MQKEPHPFPCARRTALIRFAGYHCNTERSDTLRSIDDTTNQRTDITVYGWTATATLEIDVSVTDDRQLLKGGARTTTIHPFESSQRREQHKIHKYREKVELAGSVFEHFCIRKGRLGTQRYEISGIFCQESTRAH